MGVRAKRSSRWSEWLAAGAALALAACGDDVPDGTAVAETGADTSTTGAAGDDGASTTSAAADTQAADGTASADTDPSTGGSDTGEEGGTPWVWEIPPQLPLPVVPTDNPMTVEKVALGRHLFYDPRLSFNETQSCATCHLQALAFADGEVTPVGSEGATLLRNSPGMANVAYLSPLTWANPLLPDLEQQILVPLLGENPIELGMIGHEDEILLRLMADPVYEDLFAAAFPGEDDPYSVASVTRALASFCRSMVSFGAPYDRYTYYDEDEALSDAALRGAELFFSETLECHHCHGGLNFSTATVHVQTAFVTNPFANTGVYNVDGAGAYPTGNQGLIETTFEPQDMGKFRSAPLRNISVTGPYLHDGSAATLQEVVDFYAAGGRTIDAGANAGDGTANPFKSSFVSGFTLTDAERDDLVAFLESLTDPGFLEDPAFSNPWR